MKLGTKVFVEKCLNKIDCFIDPNFKFSEDWKKFDKFEGGESIVKDKFNLKEINKNGIIVGVRNICLERKFTIQHGKDFFIDYKEFIVETEPKCRRKVYLVALNLKSQVYVLDKYIKEGVE